MSSIEKAINKLSSQKKADSRARKSEKQSMDAGDGIRNNPPTGKLPGQKESTNRAIEIDFFQLKSRGMLSPEDSSSQIAQEYRRIKRPVLKNAFSGEQLGIERGNLLMVTSAIPGEGKTFTALNLATSIAMEVDKTVLLIDADISRAGICDILQFDPGLGLSDLLVDQSLPVNETLIRTNLSNLTIMSAGQFRPNVTELFASEAMESFVTDIANRYPDRVIIFDSSPLTVTTEASVLSSLVGQVLLVVEANKTPQQVVQEAIDLIGQDKAIGVILNKTLSSETTSYGYGYGYGHEYGGRTS